MLSSAQITAILAFTGAVVAKPFPLGDHPVTSGSATFSLEQTKGSLRMRNGPNEMLKVMARYNMELPDKLVDAAKRQAKRISSLKARGLTGTVSIVPEDQYDNGALSAVSIGGKTLHVWIGTASSDIWVFSSLQPKDQLKGHDYYTVNPANRKEGYKFYNGYNGGSLPAEGLVYTEKFKLGNLSTQQLFAAATNVSQGWLNDVDEDGIIGLGFKGANMITPGPQNTFFDNLRPQLAQPIFNTAFRTKAPGCIDFGFIDAKKVDGPITYVDVLHDDWYAWGYVGDGFGIGTNPNITSRKLNTHLDTATSLMFTQPDIVTDYWARVPGAHFNDDQQAYIYPCNAKTFPDITFTVNGARQVVAGDALRSSPIDDDGKWCFGNLQNIGGGVDFGLFGIPFIKDKYIIHDMSKPNSRLGFAKLKKH